MTPKDIKDTRAEIEDDCINRGHLTLMCLEAMDEIERLRKAPETGNKHCFRCSKLLNNDIGWTHSAKLLVENADRSFSGMFRLPLCYSCSLIPHNNYDRV